MSNEERNQITTPAQESWRSEHLVNAKTLRTLLAISILAAIGVLLVNYFSGSSQMVVITGFFTFLLVISLILLQQGLLRVAQITLPSTLFIAILVAVLSDFGLHDASMFAFAAVISLASLTLGQKGMVIFSSLIIISISAIGIAEINGVLVSAASSLTTLTTLIYIVVLVIAYTTIQGTLIHLLSQSALSARKNERAQIESNQELRALQATLEKRIEERTQQIQKRADQLATIANVAHTAASLQDLEQLMSESARLISESFGFYHVAIFLLDEDGKNVILRASNSASGQRMLDAHYALPVDLNSIIGYAAKTLTARIALDTSADAVFLSNPDLQETCSEVAVPLTVGARLIGVLDVQSKQKEAFAEDDVVIISTMGNQLAMAIENTRLLTVTRNALIESEQTYQRYVRQAWSQFSQRLNQDEYRYEAGQIIPGKRKATNTKNGQDTYRLSIPLFVRGQEIGSLDIRPRHGKRDWTTDEIALVEAAAERTAMALENARLLEDSQRRAALERTIGEMASRIGATTKVDAILRTTVEELGQQLGDTEIILELESEED